jgi:hypothetical protein
MCTRGSGREVFAVGYGLFNVGGVADAESVLAPASTVDADLAKIRNLAYNLCCFIHEGIHLISHLDDTQTSNEVGIYGLRCNVST